MALPLMSSADLKCPCCNRDNFESSRGLTHTGILPCIAAVLQTTRGKQLVFCVLLLLLLVVLLPVLEFENGSREEELLLFSCHSVREFTRFAAGISEFHHQFYVHDTM